VQRSKQLAVSVATATVLTAVLPAFAPDALPWVVMGLVLLLLGRRIRRRPSAGGADDVLASDA
jgi:hypothetical protein